MADVTHQIPRREKIGYAMGDIATNFFFQSMILYQTRFYTDTAGLSAVAVGTMPENLLKWGPVHPEAARYNFEPADRYVAYGEQHGLAVIGHTLVWHQQTPR